MKKILLTRIFPDLAAKLLKNEGFEVTQWLEDRPMTRDELLTESKKYDAILCTLTDKIDVEFLSQCSHLDIISQFGVGYDNINIAETSRLKIPVGNTPDVLSDATADIAFGLMIATSRKMFYRHKEILKGEWAHFRPTMNLGFELKNKTLGVFGLGAIGIEMAKRCRGAYNMDIIYCNRKPNPQAEKELNARFVSFDELLEQSDVVSVHSVLSADTEGVFNRAAFKKMKHSAIFINTARGGIHNEIDLLAALEAGEIWGAGLDVTNPEPMKADNPLLSMPNVCILPHIGSATMEARDGMARLAAENIIGFYRNGILPHWVNKDFI